PTEIAQNDLPKLRGALLECFLDLEERASKIVVGRNVDISMAKANWMGGLSVALLACAAAPGDVLYFTNWPSRAISMYNTSAGTFTNLLTSIGSPYDLKVAPDADLIFWSDIFNGIWRSDLHGANPQQIVAPSGGQPSGIAIDLAASKIYWGELGLNR